MRYLRLFIFLVFPFFLFIYFGFVSYADYTITENKSFNSSGSLTYSLPYSVSGTTPLNFTLSIPAPSVPSNATNVSYTLKVSNSLYGMGYTAPVSTNTSFVTVNNYSTLSVGGSSFSQSSSSSSLMQHLAGAAFTYFPTITSSVLRGVPSAASINYKTTISSSYSSPYTLFDSTDHISVYYTWSVSYDIVTTYPGISDLVSFFGYSNSGNNDIFQINLSKLSVSLQPGIYYFNCSWDSAVNLSDGNGCTAFAYPFYDSTNIPSALYYENPLSALFISGRCSISGYLQIPDNFNGLLYFSLSVTSGNITFPARGFHPINYFNYRFIPISSDGRSVEDILSSAAGANSSLNKSNDELSSVVNDYYNDTDTSMLYANIDDSAFEFDFSFLTSFVPTITLISSCITSLFSSLGDFSILLNLFLYVVMASIVIGIFRFRGK